MSHRSRRLFLTVLPPISPWLIGLAVIMALSAGNAPFMPCQIGQVQYNNCADLAYSTFLGGSEDDYGYAVSADPSGKTSGGL